MAAVNYERVVMRLRAHVAEKPSHGRDELLRWLACCEQDCEIPEPEAGLYGSDLPVRQQVHGATSTVAPSGNGHV